jgi:hypothetical protein
MYVPAGAKVTFNFSVDIVKKDTTGGYQTLVGFSPVTSSILFGAYHNGPYFNQQKSRNWTNYGVSRDVTFTMSQRAGSGVTVRVTPVVAGGNCVGEDTPQKCAERGGNAFFETPVVVDGETYVGCNTVPSPCLDQLRDPNLAWPVSCADNDFLARAAALNPTAMFGVLVDVDIDGEFWAIITAGGLVAGSKVGATGIIAYGLPAVVIIGGAMVLVQIWHVTKNAQTKDAIQARPTLIQDLPARRPTLVPNNARPDEATEEADRRVRAAYRECVANIDLDVAAAAIPNLNTTTGMVGDTDEHACDAIDVYMGGGATHAGGVPITEATLHIREVLYNEIPVDAAGEAVPTGSDTNVTLPRPDHSLVTSRGPSNPSAPSQLVPVGALELHCGKPAELRRVAMEVRRSLRPRERPSAHLERRSQPGERIRCRD